MKCLACNSDETEWLETIMFEQGNEEGYEAYICHSCRSRFEIGIKVVKFDYNGKDNVFPFEKE